MKVIPIFRFELSRPNCKHYGCLTNCGVANCDEKFKQPGYADAFRTALGYTEEISRSGLFFDEYIWLNYTKEDSPQSSDQLQSKITDFLSGKCSLFNSHYNTKN